MYKVNLFCCHLLHGSYDFSFDGPPTRDDILNTVEKATKYGRKCPLYRMAESIDNTTFNIIKSDEFVSCAVPLKIPGGDYGDIYGNIQVDKE